MSPYGPTIDEHARHPRNYGSLDSPDIRAEDVNPLCGDRVRIELALADERTVRAARFQGDLCAIAKASSSLLTVMITGAEVQQLVSMSEQQLLGALGVEIPPARRNCALLPLKVLQAGLAAR